MVLSLKLKVMLKDVRILTFYLQLRSNLNLMTMKISKVSFNP